MAPTCANTPSSPLAAVPDETAESRIPTATATETPRAGIAARLSGDVVRGSFWSLSGYAFSQVLRLATNLVLTRLLIPEAFGLMALVNLFVTGLEMFSDLGIGPCIIQASRGEDTRFLNTAFSVQVVRGGLLWVVSCLLAYPFALIYREPLLARIIPVAALSVLINGCASTAVWTLHRRIHLGKVIILRVAASICGAAVMVLWAVAWPSVWALIAGSLATAAVQTAGSHLLLPRKDRFQWDTAAAASLSAFGRAVFLSTATWFLAGQAERLILGRFISLAELGVFSMAALLSSAIVSALQDVGTRVLFPAIARALRSDRSRALRQHTKVRILTLLIILPMTAILILGGNRIVSVLLDARYAAAGWMLRILAIRAAIELAVIPNNNLLMADARLKYFPVANIFRFLTIAVGTVLAFHLAGFHAALWVMCLAPAVPYLIVLWGVRKYFPETSSTEFGVAGVLAVIVGVALLAI